MKYKEPKFKYGYCNYCGTVNDIKYKYCYECGSSEKFKLFND